MYKETKSYSKDGDGNTKVNDRSGIERIKQNKFRWLNIAVKELNKRK